MGLTVNGSAKGPTAEPNVVPLIDVLFVLIIIFMVITPRVPTGLLTLIPQPPSPSETASSSEPIIVRVLQDGKLTINDNGIAWENLQSRLSDRLKGRAEKAAFVQGGAEVPFADVVRAIDVMRSTGVDHVGLIPSITTPTALSGRAKVPSRFTAKRSS